MSSPEQTMTTPLSSVPLAGPSLRTEPAAGRPPETITGGAAIVYRLFDVGYEIKLERVVELLAGNAPERAGPTRSEAQAIQIRNPPINITIATETVTIGDTRAVAEISARIFDFGVISLRARIDIMAASWAEFSALGNRASQRAAWAPHFQRHLDALIGRIRSAIERPMPSPVTEDYVVFRMRGLTDVDGLGAAGSLTDDDLAQLLLNERRPLSASARRELLPHRFSYYHDDLAILTWDGALVVEPADEDADIQYVLEFANAQLLELRVYDAMLDAELPKMYDRVEVARRRPALLSRRYAAVLGDLQTQVADVTEVMERVQNALKVTDDVYLARVYSTALEIFREREWRKGIERKLTIIRETYEMLNAEAQAARAEALEVMVVLLIVAEIALALAARH
jgi:hypothetical protein